MFIVFAVLVAFGLGFAFGRVKNVAKLAAVKAEVTKAEGYITMEVAEFAAKIKAKL